MPIHTAADGCRIHYDTFGRDGPWVALVPGLGGDGRFWAGVVGELESDFRLLVVDHRGAGRSDRPLARYSIPLIAQDTAAIIREVAGAAHVVGHSTGGAVAQELVLDHADCGLSYTISSSWARADMRFRTLFEARAELLEAGMARTYQKLTHVFGYDAAWIEANTERLEAAIDNAPQALAPLAVTAARVRMLLDHDRLDALPRIAARVQVVAADDDVLTPLYLSRAVADAIPGAAFATVPGAHFHPAADPKGFAAIIRRFIAGAAHET